MPAPTVAVVDDDGPVRTALSRLLRTLGYRTIEHASGEALLDSRSLHDVDCLLLDVHLPGLSGMEVIDRVRVAATKLPIVLMSGRYEVGLAERSLDAGASAFLRKPFDEADLVEAIEVAMSPRP